MKNTGSWSTISGITMLSLGSLHLFAWLSSRRGLISSISISCFQGDRQREPARLQDYPNLRVVFNSSFQREGFQDSESFPLIVYREGVRSEKDPYGWFDPLYFLWEYPFFYTRYGTSCERMCQCSRPFTLGTLQGEFSLRIKRVVGKNSQHLWWKTLVYASGSSFFKRILPPKQEILVPFICLSFRALPAYSLACLAFNLCGDC